MRIVNASIHIRRESRATRDPIPPRSRWNEWGRSRRMVSRAGLCPLGLDRDSRQPSLELPGFLEGDVFWRCVDLRSSITSSGFLLSHSKRV